MADPGVIFNSFFNFLFNSHFNSGFNSRGYNIPDEEEIFEELLLADNVNILFEAKVESWVGRFGGGITFFQEFVEELSLSQVLIFDAGAIQMMINTFRTIFHNLSPSSPTLVDGPSFTAFAAGDTNASHPGWVIHSSGEGMFGNLISTTDDVSGPVTRERLFQIGASATTLNANYIGTSWERDGFGPLTLLTTGDAPAGIVMKSIGFSPPQPVFDWNVGLTFDSGPNMVPTISDNLTNNFPNIKIGLGMIISQIKISVTV